MKVDMVYTWVDGSSPEYLKQYNAYASTKKDLNPERYRDPFDLMKYSMRSVAQFLPYINQIFVVTQRPQCPAWLDRDHPQISLIHHDEIIDEIYLPTFNSNVIESFLHQIPGLGEHFLFMNDDFLFAKEAPLDFYFKKSKYTVFNTFFGENFSWRIYDGFQDIVGLGLIEHAPFLVNKAFYARAYGLYPEQAHITRTSKFRNNRNLVAYKLYRYYMLKYQSSLSNPISIFKHLRTHRFHKLMNQIGPQQRFFDLMKKEPVVSYCLNDDLGSEPKQEVIELVLKFLDSFYPNPSVWEKI